MRRQHVVVESRVCAATSATDRAPCRCRMSSRRRSRRSMAGRDEFSIIFSISEWTCRIIRPLPNECNSTGRRAVNYADEQKLAPASAPSAGPARRSSRFQLCPALSRRCSGASRRQRARPRHRITVARSGARARRRRQRRGALASASRSRGIASRTAPYAADALVRRSNAAQSARRQDLVLHSLPGRGGGLGGAVHGAASGRHAVPFVPQSGAADRPRHRARRSHVPAVCRTPGTCARGASYR